MLNCVNSLPVCHKNQEIDAGKTVFGTGTMRQTEPVINLVGSQDGRADVWRRALDRRSGQQGRDLV